MKKGIKMASTLAMLVLAVSLTANIVAADSDDDNEISSREITFSDLPQSVKDTVIQESEGFKIKELQEITTKDGLIYEVEWLDGDFEVGLLINPDGKVIEREREKADADDEDGEEDDD